MNYLMILQRWWSQAVRNSKKLLKKIFQSLLKEPTRKCWILEDRSTLQRKTVLRVSQKWLMPWWDLLMISKLINAIVSRMFFPLIYAKMCQVSSNKKPNLSSKWPFWTNNAPSSNQLKTFQNLRTFMSANLLNQWINHLKKLLDYLLTTVRLKKRNKTISRP